MNELLSICIPTYNRAELLRGCLESLIPQVKKHNIPIYISDNHSDDDTKNVVLIYKEKYPHIYYQCNSQNYGTDYNEEIVLQMSKSRYSWLLGDKYRIIDGAIDDILLKLAANKYDLMVVNTGDKDIKSRYLVKRRVKDIARDKLYSDRNTLLGEIGWHMTLLSSLIFSSEIISFGNFKKYIGTSFVHVGVTFDYLADKSISVYWHSEPVVYSAGTFTWLDLVFENCAKKWFEVIQGLPDSYNKESKNKCIKDHGKKSTIFTFMVLVKLRGLGYYDLNIYKHYSRYFPYVTDVPLFVMYLLSIAPIPAWLIRVLRNVKAKMDTRVYRDQWNNRHE